MQVSVTGGTGFIGGALVRRLLGEGARVRVLARLSARADVLEASRAEVIRGDLLDGDKVERAVEGAQLVYHAAAKVRGSASRKEFMQANLEGTQNVFEACKKQGVPHVVYLSSIAVYGRAREGYMITEDTEFDFADRDKYAESKIEADKYAASIGEKTKLLVTIVRPGVVYGPGQPLPVALLGFRTGKTNFVFGRRDQRFPLTYVENLVDALRLVGARSSGGLKGYIVLDDDDLTLSQYHEALSQAAAMRALFFPAAVVLSTAIVVDVLTWIVPWDFGYSAWRREVWRAMRDRHYSTRRIREETGWTPKVPIAEAIERTLKASSGPLAG
jgi:nucleoside-diphosphate-sugar epimerase